MIQMNEMQQLLKKLEGTPEGNLLKQMMGQSRLLTRSTPGFKQIEKAQNIGVTAGASTPDNVINDVINQIEKI